MSKKENIKIQVTISQETLELLRKWAAFRGKTATELASVILAEQTEANLDLILKLASIQNELLSSENTD